MQALVAEVRQLRKDLQASNGNALKAQILLSRLQFQEEAVARASERLNDARNEGVIRDNDTQRGRTGSSLLVFCLSLARWYQLRRYCGRRVPDQSFRKRQTIGNQLDVYHQ